MGKQQDVTIEVVGSVIEQLKRGIAPWQKTWNGEDKALPLNASSGERYKGGNALILAAQERDDPRWLTYDQAKEQGAQVRKGERGTPIFFWKFEEEQSVHDRNGKPVLDAEGQPRTEIVQLERPSSCIGYVFNAEQIDGMPPLDRENVREYPVERAEVLLQASGVTLEHGGRAFYRASTDTITLPGKTQFSEEKNYFAAALHELGHRTGQLLNRELTGPPGSELRACEELRTGMVSMILGDELGIGQNPEDHAAYVKSWIAILENDPRELYRAVADAENIVNHVMRLELRQEQKLEQEAYHALDVADAAQQEIPLLSPSPEAELRYLDVPFAEKGEAKSLGAAWDRQKRLWYIPQGLEETTFSKWIPAPASQTETIPEKPERVYLAVPYEAKGEAKAAGAEWDKIAKSWYVRSDNTEADREKLGKWQRVQREQAPAMPPREEFAGVLRELGFKIEGIHPIMDGKPHRVAVEGDKAGELTGFYVGHMDGRPAGYAKNNRTDEEIRWKSSGMSITAQDREAFHAANAQKIQERNEALRQLHETTAQRIAEQVKSMHEPTAPTPYMNAKNISVHQGALLHRDGETTCLPAQNVDGIIRTMQYIQRDGTKRFAKDSQKEGCFHPVDGMNAVLKAPALVICEGYATACSLTESLGFATIAAFDAGNVVSVAKSLHAKYPDRPIVIAGDDDQELATRTGKNMGREKATLAAKEVGGQLVLPIFAPAEQKAYTDFNDLAAKSSLGTEGVLRQVRPVVQKAIALKTREREQQREQSRSTDLSR